MTKYKDIYQEALTKRSIEQINKSFEIRERNTRCKLQAERLEKVKEIGFLKNIKNLCTKN